MKNYSFDKYKIYTNNKEHIIAVSTYEGKIVRGVAKCDPRDGFDFEKGKNLAIARCREKIAKKRAARAQRELARALKDYDKATNRVNKMNDYVLDAKKEAIEATAFLSNLQKTM